MTIRVMFLQPRYRLLWIFLLCIAAGSALLYAQNAETDASGDLIFKVNARTVVVNVVVTDHSGKPVKSLRKEDFRLEEDGHPQKIASFEDHTHAQDEGAAAMPANFPALPPNVFSNIPRVKSSDVVTVVLLDSMNTELKDQSYVRKQMLQFLKNRPLGGRLAIFALGAKLHFIQGFTDNPAILTAALKDMSRGAGPVNSDLLVSKVEADVSQTVADQLLNVGNGGNPTTMEEEMAASLRQFLGEETASQADLRVALTLEAFQELAHYLAGIPGRKNVIWFSSAFPMTLFPDLTLTDAMVVQRAYTDKVRKTDALLAAAQVAVYPVAAEGLTVDSLYDVNVKMAVIGQAQQINQIHSLQVDAAERIGMHATMDQVARDTGGQAIFNTNGLGAAVAHVQEVGSSFYTLTYIPTNAASDGEFRAIHLKLPGNYTLDYRRGYFAADAKAERAAAARAPSDPLSAFMGPGKPAASDISLALRVTAGPAVASPEPAVVAKVEPAAPRAAEAKSETKVEEDAAVDFDTQPAGAAVRGPVAAPSSGPVAGTAAGPASASASAAASAAAPASASAAAPASAAALAPVAVAAVVPEAKPATPTSSQSTQGSVVTSLNRGGDNHRLSGNLKRYSVDFLLTTHGVQMTADAAGTHHGKIEAAVIAYTQGGRAVNWTEREIHFDLDAAHFAQAEKSGLNFRLEIDVPKDGFSIRSGVYDLASERAGSLEIPLSSVVASVDSAQARVH